MGVIGMLDLSRITDHRFIGVGSGIAVSILDSPQIIIRVVRIDLVNVILEILFPLVKRKQDFQNQIDEVYTYDSNNYLRTVQDRNGYTTTYTNEPVIGNPTQIKHPDNTHIDYTYSDPNNPYHIQTVTDERGKMTT